MVFVLLQTLAAVIPATLIQIVVFILIFCFAFLGNSDVFKKFDACTYKNAFRFASKLI